MNSKYTIKPIHIGILILITLASLIIEYIISVGLGAILNEINYFGIIDFIQYFVLRLRVEDFDSQHFLLIYGIWILLFSFYYYFFYSKSTASVKEESTMKELSEKIKDYELEFPKFIFTRILVYLTYIIGFAAFFYAFEEKIPLLQKGAILFGVICFLFAEAIKVILDIEANTRLTAQRSAYQLEVLIMIQKSNMNLNKDDSSPIESFIYCENCGNKCNSNSIACSSCSSIFNFNESELSEKKKEFTKIKSLWVPNCPICGNAISKNETGCRSCGFLFKDS